MPQTTTATSTTGSSSTKAPAEKTGRSSAVSSQDSDGIEDHFDDSLLDFDGLNDFGVDGSPLSTQQQRKTLFVDMGVYTRNRAFRLYASCKRGKFPHILVPLRSENSANNNNANDSAPTKPPRKWMSFNPMDEEKELFLASLVCPYSKAQLKTTPKLGTVLRCAVHAYHERSKFRSTSSMGIGGRSRTVQVVNHTPFPKLDSFVLQHVNSFGSAGNGAAYFRSVIPFYEDGETSRMVRVIYEIGGSRWCGRIGRHHRSNHVMCA